MVASAVRILDVKIQNFKNVLNGELSFVNPRKCFRASILGLYGQNGSGKTALIDSLDVLKYALCGKELPSKYADFITLGAEMAHFEFSFLISMPDGGKKAYYSFDLRKVIDQSMTNTEVSQTETYKVSIENEVLKCHSYTDKQVSIRTLIETVSGVGFIPITKRDLLVGNNEDTINEMIVSQRICNASSRSFVFSRELLSVIRSRKKNETYSEEFEYYYAILQSLVEYGNHALFVISMSQNAVISLNAQPFSFKYEEERKRAFGTIVLPIDNPIVLRRQEKEIVCRIIARMNTVLTQIIPGLTLEVRDLGPQLLENGETGNSIQLLANRNNTTIALKYESDGIRKIVSILQLLTVIYNQPNITLVVDELDSGIFEYLLGELLRIISEKGRGQLIFTSHNLRPLETLDRGFVAFTTTNSFHRYTRMKNVKGNNNLRDFYYRDIMLGGQEEKLYETTNNAEIAFAFREAGDADGV